MDFPDAPPLVYTEASYSGDTIEDPALVKQHLSEALWFKSSYSDGDGGECVEVGDNIPGVIPVRDSKLPDGPALLLTATVWVPFIGSLK
ncbi:MULTISPECIES: DUF397 domain-containing protein [Actinomycetes]